MQVAAIVDSDGETPLNCLSGITVLTYPTSNPPNTNSFIKNFDCVFEGTEGEIRISRSVSNWC